MIDAFRSDDSLRRARRRLGALGLAAGLGLAALPAAATSISVETWSAGAWADATAGWASRTTESFEGFGPGEIAGPLASAVGSFTTLGGHGTGASVTGTGHQLALRDGPNYGRMNTTAGGKTFLDSNDTLGLRWTVGLAGGAMFDRIVFSLSDVADQGATLDILAGGSLLTTLLGQANGAVNLVTIQFGSLVSAAEIRLSNSRTNDGFAIDDATVGAVPLPAGGLLLLSGLGGLALARRRRG